MAKETPRFFKRIGSSVPGGGGSTFDVIEREFQEDGTPTERVAYSGFIRREIAAAVVRMLNENSELSWAEIEHNLSSERRLAI